MHRLTVLAATASLLLSGVAMAAPAVLFENTLKVDLTNGKSGTVLPNADGTFTANVPDMKAKGTWADDGDKTCFTYEGEAEKYCAVYPANLKVGDSLKDEAGNTLTIMSGR